MFHTGNPPHHRRRTNARQKGLTEPLGVTMKDLVVSSILPVIFITVGAFLAFFPRTLIEWNQRWVPKMNRFFDHALLAKMPFVKAFFKEMDSNPYFPRPGDVIRQDQQTRAMQLGIWFTRIVGIVFAVLSAGFLSLVILSYVWK